jgi:hypothetical protein
MIVLSPIILDREMQASRANTLCSLYMKQICFLAFLFLFTSCYHRPVDLLSVKKTWVYVELEIATKGDTSEYYYFGQINQRILDKLASDENYKGFFVLENVRYYNDSDEIEDYQDSSDSGTLFFRTQDITKIEVLKTDPLYDQGHKKDYDSLNISK